jgi:hypothetical protein
MEEKNLPSGAVLRVTLAPFADSKRLYQAVLEELRAMNLSADKDIEQELIKDLFLLGFSSKKIDAALAVCLSRSLYNGVRISDETFESEKAREDYMHVCWEVAYANLRPFMKNLQLLLKSAVGQVVGTAPATP